MSPTLYTSLTVSPKHKLYEKLSQYYQCYMPGCANVSTIHWDCTKCIKKYCFFHRLGPCCNEECDHSELGWVDTQKKVTTSINELPFQDKHLIVEVDESFGDVKYKEDDPHKFEDQLPVFDIDKEPVRIPPKSVTCTYFDLYNKIWHRETRNFLRCGDCGKAYKNYTALQIDRRQTSPYKTLVESFIKMTQDIEKLQK